MQTYKAILKTFLQKWEGFSATPYWDVSRYSWGYGTAAPGATGTITRADAMKELLTHVDNDRAYLAPLLTRTLTPNQWAALLSFAYNLGPGNADNLLDNINSHDDGALYTQWMLYNKADGMYNDDLAARRAAELRLWGFQA